MGKVTDIAKKVAGTQPAPQPGKLPMDMLKDHILNRAAAQLKTLEGEQKSRIEDALRAFKAGMGVFKAEMEIIERQHHDGMMIAIGRAKQKFEQAIDSALQQGEFGELKPAEEFAKDYVKAVTPSSQPVTVEPFRGRDADAMLLDKELKTAAEQPDEEVEIPAFLERKAEASG